MAFRDPTRDIVRGLNVLEMELVNESDWPLLGHASIDSKTVTYADTVFPTFAFLAGMNKTPWNKSVGLIGLGLAYNTLRVIYRGKNFKMRYVGVLQRTGLASLILNTFRSTKYPYLFSVAATGLWYVLSVVFSKDWSDPFKTPADSAQTYLDNKIVGKDTLYRPDYDPEGLLGALTTAVTLDLGYKYATETLTLGQNTVLGASAIAAGYITSKLFPKKLPLSKPYWTPTFVLVVGGFSVLKYGLVSALVPYLPEYAQYVLTCVGRRSLEVYVSAGLILAVSRRFGLWEAIKSRLVSVFGSRPGDLILCGLWDGLLASLAVAYVKYGIKLRY